MKIVEKVLQERIIERSLVKDDGTKLDKRTEQKIINLMTAFQVDKVTGKGSFVSDASALRMVETVLKRYDLRVRTIPRIL